MVAIRAMKVYSISILFILLVVCDGHSAAIIKKDQSMSFKEDKTSGLIPSVEYAASLMGNLFKDESDTIEQCQPGKPDFMKFQGRTNAILTSADVVVEKKGFCFNSQKYSYSMVSETTQKLKVVAANAKTWTCSDVHVYSVGTQWSWGNKFFRGERNIYFYNLSNLDFDVIKARGVQVYELCDSAINILPDVAETAMLFFFAG